MTKQQAYQYGKGDKFALLNFKGAIDSREKLPWRFAGFKCDSPHTDVDLVVPTQTLCLPTGDYSIVGMSEQVCVERKSLADLYGTLGQHRERFIRELERMEPFEFRAIVVEANWLAICNRPPDHSSLHPKTVFRSLLAFAQRYGVHVYTCSTPVVAEQVCFRILERFWRDRQHGGFFSVREK